LDSNVLKIKANSTIESKKINNSENISKIHESLEKL
jgi:hypothetical protein